jgi:hypothetical protein
MRPLRDASRWVFLATLFYAPWAYGCTTAETIVGLNWLLTAVAVLWLADLLHRRKLPWIPVTLLVLLALILIIGWGMALNGRAVYDPVFGVYAEMRPRVAWLPGSYDAVLSIAMMIRISLLAVVICFVADLCQRPVWLLRIWWAIGIAGASIALLGLLEKGSGARMIFWGEWPERTPPTFFATYFYHANAGAYLNLVLLPTLGLTLRSLRPGAKPAERAIWITAGVLVLVAVLANTSRGAQAMSLLALVLFAIGPARNAWRSSLWREEGMNKLQVFAVVVIGLLAIWAVAQASRLDQPLARWQKVSESASTDSRWQAAKTAIGASPDAGFFGLGPGAFRSVFPPYEFAPGNTLAGTWRFLHNDYLQTIIEWGWIGAALLGALLFGGMVVAFVNWRRCREEWLPRHRTLMPLMLIALLSVVLHAWIDFPLQIASIQLYAGCYVGICWGTLNWSRRVIG